MIRGDGPGAGSDDGPDAGSGGASGRADGWDDDWDDDWNDQWTDEWGGDPGGDRDERSRPGLDDPRVAAGIEHLQRAAREVIAASRALLDAAEDLVDQPDGITRLAGVVADLGDLAGRTVRAAAGGAAPPGRPRPGTPTPVPRDSTRPPIRAPPVIMRAAM